MRVLKLAVISIVFLFLLLLAISALLPSTIHVARTIDIQAPYDSVYGYINDVSKWKEWYPDSAAKFSYSSNTIGRGAGITINRTMVVIQDNSKHKINTLWQTGNSAPMRGEFDFISYDSIKTVSVQWLLEQKVKWYPWEKFASIFSDKAMGPFMQQGLEKLKTTVEAQTK